MADAKKEAARKLMVVSEFSRYADPGSMSDRGAKAYNDDVRRQAQESESRAKHRFRQAEDSGSTGKVR